MAPSTRTSFPQGLKGTVLLITVVVIFSLTIRPPRTVEGFDDDQYSSRKWEREEQRKMMLGSKPPGCVNKCLNCRPCKATLVIPSHEKKLGFKTISSHREDDSYYLLSWKCRCGNKLFQP